MEKRKIDLKGLLSFPDLRKRITFLLFAFVIYLLGVHIPVPGVDLEQVRQIMQTGRGGFLGLWNMFTGGALEQLSIFALGLMPYINASIAMQLVQYAFPAYSKRIRDLGEAGRREVSRYTRYGTLFFAFFESIIMVQYFHRQSQGQLFTGSGFLYYLLVYLSLTAGSCFLLWLGEEITNKGIGQGVSLLIFAGIVVNIPRQLGSQAALSATSMAYLVKFFIYLAFLVGMIVFIVFVELSERKIPVQYARKVVGRMVMGGQFSYLPVRINIGGVIPLVFALTFLMFIQIAFSWGARFNNAFEQLTNLLLDTNSVFYYILLAVLILFCNHFYSAVVFKPDEIADNLRTYGGFIPGVRPGKPTEEYISAVQEKVTWMGGFFLVLVGVFSILVPRVILGRGAIGLFSMTGLLIAVGVTLDLIRQIEAHIVTRHYEGFIR